MPCAFQKVVVKYKLTEIFIFILLCGTSKVFMKAFKAFIKPIEVPQRSVKIKIKLILLSLTGIGTKRVKKAYFLL